MLTMREYFRKWMVANVCVGRNEAKRESMEQLRSMFALIMSVTHSKYIHYAKSIFTWHTNDKLHSPTTIINTISRDIDDYTVHMYCIKSNHAQNVTRFKKKNCFGSDAYYFFSASLSLLVWLMLLLFCFGWLWLLYADRTLFYVFFVCTEPSVNWVKLFPYWQLSMDK